MARVFALVPLLFVPSVLLAGPGPASASPDKPRQLPLDAVLKFERPPKLGEPADLVFDVAATEGVHGVVAEMRIVTPLTRPTEWLDGLTTEPKVLAAPVPWKGDLDAAAHAAIRAKVVLPEAGVYHVQGVVLGKGVAVVGGVDQGPLGFYDTIVNLWVRAGADRIVVTTGESITWTRQWNSTGSTTHGDDIPDPPLSLSMAFETLPTSKAEGILLVKIEAKETVPGLALDLEMPTAGVSVSGVATPRLSVPAEPVTVEPGGFVFDVRWKGSLAKGETATLRVPLKVAKAGWDVLRLYVSGTRAAGAPGWATHAELILVVDDVVTAARERRLEPPPAPK